MMPDLFNNRSREFLYEGLDFLSRWGQLEKEIPDSIIQNLNPEFNIRDYQIEAFARFIHCFNNDFPDRRIPLHLLFNMATGSGKTLIMAGLILYLYEKGFRNFLFFVNSTNIIKKTQDNFLNSDALKYLFNKEIYIKGKQVTISEVDNFEDVYREDINICFTTIQQLHYDMKANKENALTPKDFADKKIVLIADEAHHMAAGTRSGGVRQSELFESWEHTVEGIFNSNKENLLLEFTATHDYENSNMIDRYRNKVIYRYDLKDYRNDKFSKDIEIVKSNFSLEDRILQALILSYYKQHIASKYKIQLKPVILFKAHKTIEQSKENKSNFHKLIDNLNGSQIDRIRQSDVSIIQRAFQYFDDNGISTEMLSQQLRNDFQERYCLSVNNEKEQNITQIQVNTLEDEDNPIRAIFAVQKLNEGWDVLNLFDIVRCYETRDAHFGRPGKITISEAQLIGRGARYFPFVVPETDEEETQSEYQDKYRRKFDNDPNHELRVLEELHYHSINDSRYITEIRSALVDEGIIDETVVTHKIRLKDSFKETHLYKYGVVWMNERKERDYGNIQSFTDLADLSMRRENHKHRITSGRGGTTTVMDDDSNNDMQESSSRDIRLVDIKQNIVKSAIARNPFFKFSSLKIYFPHLRSMEDFITSDAYLGGLAITFVGDLSQLDNDPHQKFNACRDLLDKIASELSQQITNYEGTRHFYHKSIKAVFTDKPLRFSADSSHVNTDSMLFEELFVSVKDWYASDGLYGTSEERGLLRFLDRWITDREEEYDEIYLLRNERHFSIYNFFDGRTFQPDFVLFLYKKNGESKTYQLFIEPKGQHLEVQDRWKEDFLKEIRTYSDVQLLTENSEYRIFGVGRFYNMDWQNEFRDTLNEIIEEISN